MEFGGPEQFKVTFERIGSWEASPAILKPDAVCPAINQRGKKGNLLAPRESSYCFPLDFSIILSPAPVSCSIGEPPPFTPC